MKIPKLDTKVCFYCKCKKEKYYWNNAIPSCKECLLKRIKKMIELINSFQSKVGKV